MQRQKDKLIRHMMQTSFEVVRAAFIARAREQADRVREGVNWLESQGYERIQADTETFADVFLPDGRTVIEAHGIRWAISAERYKQHKTATLARAAAHQSVGSPPAKPGEGLTSVLCPSCQSVMAKAYVCPNCAKGKKGFRILCTCTECGHEVYL